MDNSKNSTFWIPLLLAIAFLFFGWGVPALGVELPPYSALAALVSAVLFVIWAGILAYQGSTKTTIQSLNGGSGGYAAVDGNHSSAEGGDGGVAGAGKGGDGGGATVHGNNSSARGGRGGNG